MATTNIIYAGIDPPRLSPWQRLKRALIDVVESFPLVQSLCCLDANEVAHVRRDIAVRSQIREALRVQMGFTAGTDCVTSVMHEAVREEGYLLGDIGVVVEANRGVTRTASQWRAYLNSLGYHHGRTWTRPVRARIIPRFAAAMTLCLRAKLGTLVHNEANLLLVQRKYLEVCNRHHVRQVDVVSHQQFVINAFFSEDVLDRDARVRGRMPRWLRWALDIDPVPSLAPTAC